MAYQINLSPSAIADIENAYLWLRSTNKVFADEWFNGLTDAIDSLAALPARCPVAPESKELDREIRQLLFRKSKRTVFRILFEISETEVNIYRIRHTAQQYLSKEDFDI
jgi:plasmid stabilization system protein ParE